MKIAFKISTMRKILILPILLTFIHCASVKKEPLPDYVIGIQNKNTFKKVPLKEVQVVFPGAEIYIKDKNKTEIENTRKQIQFFVLSELEKILHKKTYANLELMSKDNLTINKVLESISYKKYLHPEWIVKAPKEIINKRKKYSLLFNMYGSRSDYDGGIFFFYIINNETEIIEKIIRREIDSNPLDKTMIISRIKRYIPKLIDLK